MNLHGLNKPALEIYTAESSSSYVARLRFLNETKHNEVLVEDPLKVGIEEGDTIEEVIIEKKEKD